MLKIKKNLIQNLKYYGFTKQSYLIEYGEKVETGCNLWRYGDRDDYYGITVFEKTPKKGYFAPSWGFDAPLPRVLYMMRDDSSYMESCWFDINPIIYKLIQDGLVENEED